MAASVFNLMGFIRHILLLKVSMQIESGPTRYLHVCERDVTWSFYRVGLQWRDAVTLNSWEALIIMKNKEGKTARNICQIPVFYSSCLSSLLILLQTFPAANFQAHALFKLYY